MRQESSSDATEGKLGKPQSSGADTPSPNRTSLRTGNPPCRLFIQRNLNNTSLSGRKKAHVVRLFIQKLSFCRMRGCALRVFSFFTSYLIYNIYILKLFLFLCIILYILYETVYIHSIIQLLSYTFFLL